MQGSTTMGNPSDWDPNYKAPGALKLRLSLFWGSNYTVDKSKEIVEYAGKLLGEHGIGLDVYPGKTRTDAHTIKTSDIVMPEEYNDLRLKMGAVFDDQKTADKRQRLPVLFCQFKQWGNGLTVLRKGTGDPDSASPWPAYVLIGMNADPDYSNLIHEIGHAAMESRQHSLTKGHIMHDAPSVQRATSS
jgi:hypothetical protein